MPTDPWETSGPPRLLVIDDNPTVHDAFDGIFHRDAPNKELEAAEAILFGPAKETRVLKPAYEIDHALSGCDGVEKVRRAVEEKRPYQVAFVDIQMPGIDGVETIGRMWQVDHRIQTVICTAYADYDWKDLAERFGRTDRLLVLKKPFHDIEVMQLASTLAQKWLLGKDAALKYEQMEVLVAERTRKLIEFHQREHRRIHDLDQTKLKCLFRLAQEFRGPLTVILNPIEDMTSGKPLDRAKQEIIRRNVHHLLRLVEDSLLMRRLATEDTSLDVQETDLVLFVRGLVHGFAEGAQERGLKLSFKSDLERCAFRTDTSKLEKVLFSLLAQAFDLAVTPGGIDVSFRCESGLAIVTIQTPAARIPERAPPVNSGPGKPDWINDNDITLLSSQEIIRSIKGALTIDRPAGGKAGKPAGLRLVVEIPCLQPDPSAVVARSTASPPAPEESGAEEREIPLILLVFENDEFGAFIREGLGGDYRLDSVSTAEDVVRAALETVPDLILFDFDREKNDAVNLCLQLKKNEISSHIPIILLGADVSEAGQLAALNAGVDDFLGKPFRLPLLKARVGNLLETRRKLHQHFEDLATVQPREMASNSVEAEFLQRVVVVVEKHLADYEFDVGALARKMAMSRRQLFRKFKAVTGSTPNTFIRDIRLNRAAKLLKESRLTVSEIIYSVGFSDPKHFRTVFRERFGVLPSDFAGNSKPE